MAASEKLHVKNPPKDVKILLTRYPVLMFQEDSNKIKCSLSGYEMPCKADAVLSYVSGKKFLKLFRDKEFGFEKYEPHLVPSFKKKCGHLLFCRLTFRHINKTPRDVARHVNGKKYKKALERWQKCQETGEKFKPLGHRKKLEQTDEEVPDFLNSDDENQSDSNLSDLYPGEDFETIGDEEMDLEDDDSEINVANGNLSKDTNSSEGENIQNIGDHSEPKKIKLSVSTNVPHTRKTTKERPKKKKKKNK